MTKDEIEQEIKQLFIATSVRAIHLAASTDTGGISKLGGLPDVPPEFEWPNWKDRPLEFIAQLDLGAMPRLENLPELPATGVLYFFYDQEQRTWGFDPEDKGSWRTIYWPEVGSLKRASAPPGLENDNIYGEKYLSPRIVTSYPSDQRVELPPPLEDAAKAADVNLFDIYNKLVVQEIDYASQHQIGGFPNPEQYDGMEMEAQLASHGIYCGGYPYNDPRAQQLADGAKEWQLLLQIDSDDDTGMDVWGHDIGKLYFWITRSALAKRDFSTVWMVLQCG